ncbi:exported hypothetical protein [Xanthomonas citri pv. citri]|nr:exported hypothetical protein [Xanthomonas citri pv. citri]CEH87341.1 exported hypothetical protein [Xanthomonas citri pv. citri]
MKPLVITVALALGTCLPLQAQTSQSIAKVPASPAWVQTSNGYAQILLNAQAPFQPEYASFFGVPGYDDQVVDLGPDNAARYRDAMRKARATLQTKLTTERDANVRQDLQIMIGAAEQNIEGSELNERYLLPWSDAPEAVFSGLNGLLSDQTVPERRAKALDRLKRYVGLVPGSTPTTTLARQRYEEKLSNKALLQPTQREVEQALANVDTYVAGIGELFAKYKIAGADEALKAMSMQLKDYAAWTRSTVLPKARKDTRLPEPLSQAGRDRYRPAAVDPARATGVHGDALGHAPTGAAGGQGQGRAGRRLCAGDPRPQGQQDRRRPVGNPLPRRDRSDRPDHPPAAHRRCAQPPDADAPGQRRRKRGPTGPALPAGPIDRQYRPAGPVRVAAGQPDRRWRQEGAVRRLQLRLGRLDA